MVTKCSLTLFAENSPQNDSETNIEQIYENYEVNPDLITTESQNNQIEDMSDKRRDASAAKKLFLVIIGFLICWLPYFLWLPFSTLLVSILYSF